MEFLQIHVVPKNLLDLEKWVPEGCDPTPSQFSDFPWEEAVQLMYQPGLLMLESQKHVLWKKGHRAASSCGAGVLKNLLSLQSE